MRKKVTVVGAGNVGATTAQRIFDKGYADVVLVDIVDGLPQGKALDMLESGPILNSDSSIIGTNKYDDTSNSDVVVITSGLARKPGMTRDDLLLTNKKIVSSVTARFRTFLAEELNVSVESVSAFVLGGHGDTMVPVVGNTTVGGTPISKLITEKRLEEIVQRTRDGGAEIVSYLKTGSAYYAPSASIVQMVESIIFDKKDILPCTTYLDGEYGISGLYVGVPVKLGANGVEEIIEFDLNKEELAALRKSADAVKELIEIMDKDD